MIIDELLREEFIDLNLNVSSKQQFFESVATSLLEKKCIEDTKLFIEDLYVREEIESTNLIDKIAIPHSKTEVIKKSSISLYRFKEEIDWEDNKDNVKVAFVIAVSPHQKNITHLEAIAALATLLMEEDFVSLLLTSTSKKEIINYIKSEIGGE